MQPMWERAQQNARADGHLDFLLFLWCSEVASGKAERCWSWVPVESWSLQVQAGLELLGFPPGAVLVVSRSSGRVWSWDPAALAVSVLIKGLKYSLSSRGSSGRYTLISSKMTGLFCGFCFKTACENCVFLIHLSHGFSIPVFVDLQEFWSAWNISKVVKMDLR